MLKLTIDIANKAKLGALFFAFLFASFSYAETSRELGQDESRVILAVENMT